MVTKGLLIQDKHIVNNYITFFKKLYHQINTLIKKFVKNFTSWVEYTLHTSCCNQTHKPQNYNVLDSPPHQQQPSRKFLHTKTTINNTEDFHRIVGVHNIMMQNDGQKLKKNLGERQGLASILVAWTTTLMLDEHLVPQQPKVEPRILVPVPCSKVKQL